MAFRIRNKTGTWVTVAEPKLGGITVTDEPIWSDDTGRVASGQMAGDIKAWKTTIDVEWPPLTYSQVKVIRDAIGAGDRTRAFFDIEYPDIAGGISNPNQSGETLGTVQKKVYIANIPRNLYSTSTVYRRYFDLKLSFVEQ